MYKPPVLLAAAALSATGAGLTLLETNPKKRVISLASAVAAIAAIGAYIRLVQIYDARPLSVVIATRNPMAGLGPWDGLALLLSLVAMAGSVFGAKKASAPLLISAIVLFGYTLHTLTLWD